MSSPFVNPAQYAGTLELVCCMLQTSMLTWYPVCCALRRLKAICRRRAVRAIHDAVRSDERPEQGTPWLPMVRVAACDAPAAPSPTQRRKRKMNSSGGSGGNDWTFRGVAGGSSCSTSDIRSSSSSGHAQGNLRFAPSLIRCGVAVDSTAQPSLVRSQIVYAGRGDETFARVTFASGTNALVPSQCASGSACVTEAAAESAAGSSAAHSEIADVDLATPWSFTTRSGESGTGDDRGKALNVAWVAQEDPFELYMEDPAETLERADM
jgi:hypothetical protein